MPYNAIVVLVVDFETGAIMHKVERFFGDLPVGPQIPKFRAEEPEQQGERRLVVRRPGPAEYVQIGYHTPDCRHRDFAALVLLDAVLSGAKGMGFGGGAQTHRSARIYRGLVETQLASYAGSSFRAMHDPYLFELDANVQHGHTAAEVEAALIREVEQIQQHGVDEAEMTKVVKQARAQMAYSSEGVTQQALRLGMWEVLDRYSRLDTLLDELAGVTAADVRRVAQEYLIEDHRTVGHFIPVER
jgi:zinc protease